MHAAVRRLTPSSSEPSVTPVAAKMHVALGQFRQVVDAVEIRRRPSCAARRALVVVAEQQPALELAADAAQRRAASTPSGAPPEPI